MHFINLSSVSLFLSLLIGSEVVDAKIPIKGTFTGINSQTGERPARREIRDLRNDTPQFSLYIQALTAMMDTPETDALSYFQIAGIHGRPFYNWDDNRIAPGAANTGYCPHGNTVFISWHRPYLALFEQVIAGHAQRIAKEYNSATWTNAANNLRIPWIGWEGSTGSYEIPDFMGTSTIRIQRPNGPADVPNVLASYRFRRQPYPASTFPRDSLGSASRTRRRPAFPDGPSNLGEVNGILRAQGPGITQQIYNIFSRSRDYNSMATDATGGASFENPHGWFHVVVGGEGHMTSIEYSAFDPLFWMHHATVDRLAAIWQAANPRSDMQPSIDGAGTRWSRAGSTLNAQTPLIPFHGSDSKTPYNTEKVKFTKKFGYSYPGLRDWEFNNENSLANAATALINQLYNTRRSAKRSIRGETSKRAGVPHEWTAAVSAPKNAMGGKSFTVSFFLGKKPDNVKDWPLKSIGGLYVISQPILPTAMTMPPANTEVFLTDAMADAGIDTSNVNASRNFLDSDLHWGVSLSDGTIVPNEEFKSFLNITIEDQIVKLPTVETELPKFSNLVVHSDITDQILSKR